MAVVKLPGVRWRRERRSSSLDQEDAEVAIQRLWADHVHHTRPVDVVIESWLPWDSTHSLSYLV